MLFFQGVLIAGYAYADWSARWRNTRASGALHLCLVVLAATVLPLQLLPGTLPQPGQSGPVSWLLLQLGVLIGLPFFALSGTAPLLQKWFSRTSHARAGDPYFLYAASNAGSLLGLFAYLAFLEPNIGLYRQGRMWSWGYWILAGLILVSLVTSQRLRRTSANAEATPASVPDTTRVGWGRRGFWIFAAFVPSSLMLGVTLHLSTDIGAFPFLWVVPLGLYLLSHVLVFAKRQILPLRWIRRVFPVCIVAVALVLCTGHADPPALVGAVHLLVFFGAAMICHGRLAESRPPVAQLTGFYFCMALGGVLGGAFNALLAPVLFNTIVEYPLALVLACTLLLPRNTGAPAKGDRRATRKSRRSRRELVPARQGAAPWLRLSAVAGIGLFTFIMGKFVTEAGVQSLQLQAALVLALPLISCWALAERPVWFAMAVAALFLGSISYPSSLGRKIHTERSFFGVSRVTVDSVGGMRQLAHGNTIHGSQYIDPERAAEPIAYYHRAGPAGDIFRWLNAQAVNARVAVVGLGAGSLLAYSKQGQTWTVFEIDPVVARIAADPRYFTYLGTHAADSLEVVLGDGRLGMQETPAQGFDLIVLDAFNSDAIPIHLLTREAVELYLSKLAPGGMLTFHISSRYFRLEPILGAVAESLEMRSFARADLELIAADLASGREQSHWVVMARPGTRLEPLLETGKWRPLVRRSDLRVWTDDFSSPLKVLQ